MSRYIDRSPLTVSQEFTVIELAIGLGIGVGIYKLWKKQSGDASKSARNVKDTETREKLETAISRYNELIAMTENATSIKEVVPASTDAFFGGAGEAGAIIYHLNNKVVTPIETFLNKTEPLVEKLIKMSTDRNSNAPTVSKGAIEADFEKLMNIIESTGKLIQVNGFMIFIQGYGSEKSIESSMTHSRVDDRLVKCPTPEQFQKLMVLAGSLLKLMGRTAEDKIPADFSNSYLSHDLQYIGWMNEMLDSTLYSLTGYLLKSLGK